MKARWTKAAPKKAGWYAARRPGVSVFACEIIPSGDGKLWVRGYMEAWTELAASGWSRWSSPIRLPQPPKARRRQ